METSVGADEIQEGKEKKGGLWRSNPPHNTHLLQVQAIAPYRSSTHLIRYAAMNPMHCTLLEYYSAAALEHCGE